MKQSALFTKTRRSAPAGEEAKNASLLIRAGFIHKESAGVYAMLPLGLRVLSRISELIRSHMNGIGGQEVLLTALQDQEVWKKSDRWDSKSVDVWFKTVLNNKTEMGLGFTHEEPLTELLTNHIQSYRDLPAFVYQIQHKFRNELRAKSGMLRGREFLMKDLYSFVRNPEEHNAFYEKITEVYRKIFDEVGIGKHTFFTFASGGSFSKYSHEFQTISDAGEDVIFLDRDKGIAINKEVYTEAVAQELGLDPEKITEEKSIEVGNIFSLGTRFSEALNLSFVDEKGVRRPVIMGSYGIGVTRIMGVVAEVLGTEKSMVWPKRIAPFSLHLISLGNDEVVQRKAVELYEKLGGDQGSVLFDDLDCPPGEKFADAELIGIPFRAIVSEKTLRKESVEFFDRLQDQKSIVPYQVFLDQFLDH